VLDERISQRKGDADALEAWRGDEDRGWAPGATARGNETRRHEFETDAPKVLLTESAQKNEGKPSNSGGIREKGGIGTDRRNLLLRGRPIGRGKEKKPKNLVQKKKEKSAHVSHGRVA